jgi:hypothetical protein
VLVIDQSGFLPWLRDNVYVAGWLSPIIALIGMLFKRDTAPGVPANWSLRIVYITCLTSLAATLTPVIDDGARFFAGAITAVTVVFSMFHAWDMHEVIKGSITPRKGPG